MGQKYNLFFTVQVNLKLNFCLFVCLRNLQCLGYLVANYAKGGVGSEGVENEGCSVYPSFIVRL